MISGNNSLLCSAAQTDIVKLIVCVALTIKGTLIFEASKEKKKKGKCREKRGDEGTHKLVAYFKPVSPASSSYAKYKCAQINNVMRDFGSKGMLALVRHSDTVIFSNTLQMTEALE